ncbi:ferritin-like domain-containing protein [Fulvimarina sp. 2208YS6-2-32]|uniref:Ferritin-like domain-containing protein n=1 Tax=Fulvimarina uroteuthidis TaxID=3098149 RepID=A0ABU5I5I4_9HYPH|nr:ferritin-like domain-containing protein [Fulvimarina sp. 2208YS6-2-32]MDY8110632.1 ferritin-like domain-containing protein [Fulvimarina sp. 2208YS6-2-32]
MAGDPSDRSPSTLRQAAILALRACDVEEKRRATNLAGRLWFARTLGLHAPDDDPLPDRPGRPARPELVHPRTVKRRSVHSEAGRVSLIHAIAHIELNAIDLALDIVARFADQPIPRSFFDGWMTVALEEAKHFGLLSRRLEELHSFYGALPAHDGLWQAVEETAHDLAARLAVVPLILEARGLDVTPSMIDRLTDAGDPETAAILKIIYHDEKKHVAIGAKWFRFLCARQRVDPAKRFHDLVRECFRGEVKPPFNDRARAEAGLTPTFYRSLSPLSR